MFHTDPDQPPKLLSLEYHCCCEAVATTPSTLVSEM